MEVSSGVTPHAVFGALTLHAARDPSPDDCYPESSPPTPSPVHRKPTCAICLGAMVDPATGGGCCHHFCLSCYESWVERNGSCPTCRAPVFALLRDTEFAALIGGGAVPDAGNAAAAAAEAKPLLEGQTLISVPSGGAMGLTVSNTAEGRGVRVHALVKGNCADRAGLRKGDIVLQVCGIKVHDHAIAIQLIERRMVIGGAIELFVERKEDVSKRGGGMRLWRRPVAPGPILGLATE